MISITVPAETNRNKEGNLQYHYKALDFEWYKLCICFRIFNKMYTFAVGILRKKSYKSLSKINTNALAIRDMT